MKVCVVTSEDCGQTEIIGVYKERPRKEDLAQGTRDFMFGRDNRDRGEFMDITEMTLEDSFVLETPVLCTHLAFLAEEMTKIEAQQETVGFHCLHYFALDIRKFIEQYPQEHCQRVFTNIKKRLNVVIEKTRERLEHTIPTLE